MRRVISACRLLFLIGATCLALQAQLSPEPKAEMFSGRDPLAGAAAGTPLPTSGPCVPPRNSNWTLVGQDRINCYWYAPYPQRLNGYVTSVSNVGAVEKLGGRCGVDEFDASKAVCQNAGDQFATLVLDAIQDHCYEAPDAASTPAAPSH